MTSVAIVETLLWGDCWKRWCNCRSFDLTINQGGKSGANWLRLVRIINMEFVFDRFWVIRAWLFLLWDARQILSFGLRLISLRFSDTNFLKVNWWLYTVLLDLTILWMVIHIWFFGMHPIVICALHLIRSDYFLQWISWGNSDFLLLPEHHIRHELRYSRIFIIDGVMASRAFFENLSVSWIFSHDRFLIHQQFEIPRLWGLPVGLYLWSMDYSKVERCHDIFFINLAISFDRVFPWS